MNKISFIIEFDEVSKTQEEQLTEFIEKTGIKFQVLESDNDLKKYKKYKEVIDKANKLIYYNIKYRNGADIYQFVDIESEILEPLKYILEQDEENDNAYLKEFNDWLKEVE